MKANKEKCLVELLAAIEKALPVKVNVQSGMLAFWGRETGKDFGKHF